MRIVATTLDRMKVTRQLEAHQIIDKNGVRRTVWKKPALPSSSRIAALKPVLSTSSSTRQHDEGTIRKHLDHYNTIQRKQGWNWPMVSDRSVDIAMTTCNDNELHALTQALESGDDAIREVIMKSASRDTNFNKVVNAATVYEPDMHKDALSNNYRILCITQEIRMAYFFMHGKEPDENWRLADEDEQTQDRVKRFVRVWQAIENDDEAVTPSDDLLERALDDSRTDHDSILDILRSNSKATCEQIDFILAGGSASISSGML